MKKKKREDINYQDQNEIGDITTDPVDIKRIVKKYYKQLCTRKFYNLKWASSSKNTITTIHPK